MPYLKDIEDFYNTTVEEMPESYRVPWLDTLADQWASAKGGTVLLAPGTAECVYADANAVEAAISCFRS